MTMRFKNIRFRLIAWYVVSLGLVHGVVGTGLYQRVSARLHGEFDERLATYAGCLVELLPQHKGSACHSAASASRSLACVPAGGA